METFFLPLGRLATRDIWTLWGGDITPRVHVQLRPHSFGEKTEASVVCGRDHFPGFEFPLEYF